MPDNHTLHHSASQYQCDEYVRQWLQGVPPEIDPLLPEFQQRLDNEPQCVRNRHGKQTKIHVQSLPTLGENSQCYHSVFSTHSVIEERHRRGSTNNYSRSDCQDGIRPRQDYQRVTDERVDSPSVKSCIPRATSPPFHTGKEGCQVQFLSQPPVAKPQVPNDSVYRTTANDESPSKKYARRKRHRRKLEEDELKGDQKTNMKPASSKHRHKKRKNKMNKTGMVLNQEFEAVNVVPGRLINQRGTNRGLFSKAKSSTALEYRDVPDLTISGMNFLSQRKRWNSRNIQDFHKKPKQEIQKRAMFEVGERFSDKTKPCKFRESKGSPYQARAGSVRVNDDMCRQIDSLQSPQLRGSSTQISWSLSPERNLSMSNQKSAMYSKDGTQIEDKIRSKSRPRERNMSFEEYTRKALIRDEPGVWQKSKSIGDTDSIQSVSDLRALARKLEAIESTTFKSHGRGFIDSLDTANAQDHRLRQLGPPDIYFPQEPAPSFPNSSHYPVNLDRRSDTIDDLEIFASHKAVETAVEVGDRQDRNGESQSRHLARPSLATFEGLENIRNESMEPQHLQTSGIKTHKHGYTLFLTENKFETPSIVLRNHTEPLSSSFLLSEDNSYDILSIDDSVFQGIPITDSNLGANSHSCLFDPTQTHDFGSASPTITGARSIIHHLALHQTDFLGAKFSSLIPNHQGKLYDLEKGNHSLFHKVTHNLTFDDPPFTGYSTPNNLY